MIAEAFCRTSGRNFVCEQFVFQSRLLICEMQVSHCVPLKGGLEGACRSAEICRCVFEFMSCHRGVMTSYQSHCRSCLCNVPFRGCAASWADSAAVPRLWLLRCVATYTDKDSALLKYPTRQSMFHEHEASQRARFGTWVFSCFET